MFRVTFVLLLSVLLGGCELVGNIFQAGMAVGVIAVLLVVIVLFWVAKRFRGGKADTPDR